MRAEWEKSVKESYPLAVVQPEKTYGGTQLFTCIDPETKQKLGPTAFTEDSAWRYAAERVGQ
jgi:hypothetical protein